MSQCLNTYTTGGRTYLIFNNSNPDPTTCTYVALTGSELSKFNTLLAATTEPFDYTLAAGFWSLAFTFVLGLYLISKKVGFILQAVRNY